MSIRFSGQNGVEALNEAIALGDIITVKLRNHFGQDSKNRFVCEVIEILPRAADSTAPEHGCGSRHEGRTR